MRTIKLPMLRRLAPAGAGFAARVVDEDKRTVDLAFSSEVPQRRFFGLEVLGHDAGEADLSRVGDGMAPLLLNHDPDQQIGVVETASIDRDHVGRARVRFSRAAAAEEVFRDVADGIRNGVSVGYRVNRVRLEESDEKDETYRVTDWSLVEISIAATPLDAGVGVGRAEGGENREVPVEVAGSQTQEEGNRTMEDTTTPAASEAAAPVAAPAAVNTPDLSAIRAGEREAVAEIYRLGQRHNRADLAEAAVRDGVTLPVFRGQLLDALDAGTPIDTPANQIGASGREARGFSFLRALRAFALKDWAGAELERDMIQATNEAMRRASGREPNGFFVPREVLYDTGQRDMTVGTAGTGAELLGTDHRGDLFIDRLRERLLVRRLGATMLGGLVGDVSIPKVTAGATAYHLATESTAVTESNLTTAQLALAPKTVAARTDLSHKMIRQGSPDAEELVRSDLQFTLASKVDEMAINGSGASGEPTGILGVSGIGDVAGGANGAAPTWANIVELETDVASANADVDGMAYLTTPGARGTLKTTEKATGTAKFIWGEMVDANGFASMNGYRAAVSTNVPSNLTKGTGTNLHAIIFGNWRDVVIAEWGILDLTSEAVTLADIGGLTVRAFFDYDIGLRQPGSISAMQDAIV